MTHSENEARLYELWSEVADIDAASEILGWDQETYMPPKGQVGRGKVLATLAGLRHAKLTAPELGDAIAACAEEAEPDSVLAAQAREARRKYERAARVPAELAKRFAEAKSTGLAAWQKARAESDFSLFEKELADLFGIVRDTAECLAPLVSSGRPYDALLDEFEPGSSEEKLAPLFGSLRESLSPLVKGVAESGTAVDESVARGSFPRDKQYDFGLRVAKQMGFDLEAGRLDAAPHPFCSGFNNGDVRITWRWQEDDFRPALYGIMHEAGHGLYEQGLPDEWARTPLGQAASLGVHESQSRLWENLVGRSRAFWTWALPLFKESFAGTGDATVDAIWSALHTVTPSTIRVEADEATYNLHIVVRFELERALFAGDLALSDLPGAWDDAYEELLGIRPRNVAEGVLQDIHFSMGAFGYFPTYTLGNLINAQLFAKAREELGDLEALFSTGDFAPLLGWLREKIHRHGALYSADELIERATGKPLSSEHFLDYIRSTTEEVYGVRV
ncbi:MAG: carboxypeptidase M32 [Planctomycetota bacterium]|nr:carboxypeptidase M32 [Planctomycetota bacterium]